MHVGVTEGAGVANVSGAGTWEDVAGRAGSLDDIKRLRQNIITFGKGSGASFKAFSEPNADAWITWSDWPITHFDQAELVKLSPERTIWRDVNVVLARDADPQARQFIDFLVSERGAEIVKTEGWAPRPEIPGGDTAPPGLGAGYGFTLRGARASEARWLRST